uniref:SKP1 component POZ domain-containing protein n=1 Tax=Oryza meridionalis TaxID=40149 RepID=A0A0E0EEN5_9ORYZ
MTGNKRICYSVGDEDLHGRRQGRAEHVVIHSQLRRLGRHGIRISKVIGDKIDAGRGGEAIPLPHIDNKTLKKVIEYCDEHANENSDTDEQKEELKNWDKAFIDELDEDDGSFLFEVLLASTYLKIDRLFDLTYQRVADNSKVKTTEEIRKAFSTIEIELSDKEEDEEQQQEEEETRPENIEVEVEDEREAEAVQKAVSDALEKVEMMAEEKGVMPVEMEVEVKVVEVEDEREAETVVEKVEMMDEEGEDAPATAADKLLAEALTEALEKAGWDAAEMALSDDLEKVSLEAEEQEEESARMITLESSDGEAVKVKEASARLSKTIGNIIDDGRGDEAIPLPDVSYKTLKKVVEYCDKHADEKSDTDEQKEGLKNWDKAFIDELAEDDDSLVKVIMASNYLKIDGLHNLASQCKTTREQIGKA